MKWSGSNKDLALKLLCKALFDQMGYVNHLEVRLRTKSYIQSIKVHDVSDIDVLGLRFQPDMTLLTIGAECKSGGSSALEELYKFIGVKEYARLDKGYFIKTKIHQNARQVATEKQISCFTEAEIRKLLIGLDVDPDKQLEIERAKYGKLVQSITEYRNHNEKLVDYIRYDFWNKDNWKNIHNIVHLLGSKGQMNLLPAVNVIPKIFVYYSLECLSFSVLKNLHYAMMVNYSDVEEAVKNSLYGGPEALSEKQRLYDMVNQALNENKSFSPDWESEFISMSSRFASHARDSAQIMHLLRDIRENAFYKDKVDIKPTILRRYSDLTRKFTQDLIHFASKASGNPLRAFDEFMAV